MTAARAYLSDDGRYRYSLTRHVAPLTGDGVCTFVMLNPSTADATHDDPTIRRCIGFARAWGFEWLKVVNLFAYRATDPRDLWAVDPYPPYATQVGPENDCTIAKVVGGSDLVVCAWEPESEPRRAGARPDRRTARTRPDGERLAPAPAVRARRRAARAVRSLPARGRMGG